MAEVVLLIVVALCGVVLGALGLWCLQIQTLPPMPPPIVAPPATVTPKIEPLPPAKPQPVVSMTFVSGSGRLLGTAVVRGRRPASYTYRTGDGLLGNFVCSDYKNGTWIYRRVGVEREDGR